MIRNRRRLRHWLPGVALAAALVALLAMPGAGMAATRHHHHHHKAVPITHNPRGRFLGVVRVRGAKKNSNASSPGGGTPPLTYHGGPVMHSIKTYAIFWQPSGTYIPPSYKSTIGQYFQDVATNSYLQSNVFAVGQQYSDTSGRFAAYKDSYGGQFTDTDAFPASGCTDSATSTCLTDAQINSELSSFITAHSLPKGMTTEYFVFTPPNIGSCFDSTNSSCAFTEYCAYHTHVGSGTSTVLYANQPFAGGVSGCDAQNYPNGSSADATMSVASHEQNETMTDPLGTAWFDSSGFENGDECNFTYGTALGSTGAQPLDSFGFNTSDFNQLIVNDYMLQEEWSNKDGTGGSCRKTNPDAVPTASFTVSPTSPTHGSPATFTATASDADGIKFYDWSWGDGTTTGNGGAHPTHTYSTAGSKTVTLTVTDNIGSVRKVVKTITVG